MKIVWERDTPTSLILYARIFYDHGPVTQTGLRDTDLDPIQEWCNKNIPTARRLSFDTWIFKSEKQITMFLMRWA